MEFAGSRNRVVVLGGGFAGAFAAQTLSRRLPSGWRVVLIDRNNFLLFYPLLLEAGVGSVEPRHVAVPLRKFLRRRKNAEFLMAEVRSVDLEDQQVEYSPVGDDESHRLHFDHLVIAVGSITKLPPIPGLVDYGFDVKSLADAIQLRDRAVRMLELANTTADRSKREELLRVVTVGSNFSGIEFAGEYHDFMTGARDAYPRVERRDIHMMVIEYADRILPALDPELAEYARKHLIARGLDIRTRTSVKEVREDSCVLTTGEVMPTRTVVWCAGIAPNPILDAIPGLPRDEKGYVKCDPTLRVQGFDNVWAAGDIAHVLDPSGAIYAATAQNAQRQGTHLAKNLARQLGDLPLRPFQYSSLGSIAALGCRTAVAKVFGVKLSGFIAWWLYRTVYLMKMPSWAMRVRLVLDWTTDLFFRREPVQLGMRAPDEPRQRPVSRRDEEHAGVK